MHYKKAGTHGLITANYQKCGQPMRPPIFSCKQTFSENVPTLPAKTLVRKEQILPFNWRPLFVRDAVLQSSFSCKYAHLPLNCSRFIHARFARMHSVITADEFLSFIFIANVGSLVWCAYLQSKDASSYTFILGAWLFLGTFNGQLITLS